ncbi:hypothetical protein B0H17DRAFT_1222134 [Mycena rosella]|uniref:Uncharacterized protein n=1 Tax=Mycena rosella TaxID=1033263 RepID=A0AAD7AZB8_MYCRO|nr:hypothetical protein B0H17DRAFT_1222134 [Mycena rosella]
MAHCTATYSSALSLCAYLRPALTVGPVDIGCADPALMPSKRRLRGAALLGPLAYTKAFVGSRPCRKSLHSFLGKPREPTSMSITLAAGEKCAQLRDAKHEIFFKENVTSSFRRTYTSAPKLPPLADDRAAA